MAKTRSPRYPNVSLADALSRARSIYETEHMSPLTAAVAAEAMGYSGINGASLKMISSLKKYGLLEGRGDELRLTKDAQTLIIDSPENLDFQSAIQRCALNPDIFSEIRRQFQAGGSERNISVYLEKQGFKPNAASIVARNYRETIALIEDNLDAYEEKLESEVEAPPLIPRPQQQREVEARGSIRDADAPYRIVQNGKHLEIFATVDLNGLRKLRRMLETYETLLEMMEDSTTQKGQSLSKYYVNKNAQTNGYHEVHKAEGCPTPAAEENRVYLGTFDSCHVAVREAKKHFPQSNGCAMCLPECHVS